MMDETELAIVSAFLLSLLSYSYIESFSTDLRKLQKRVITRKNFSIIAIQIQLFPILREIPTTAKPPVVLSPIPRGKYIFYHGSLFHTIPFKISSVNSRQYFYNSLWCLKPLKRTTTLFSHCILSCLAKPPYNAVSIWYIQITKYTANIFSLYTLTTKVQYHTNQGLRTVLQANAASLWNSSFISNKRVRLICLLFFLPFISASLSELEW